MCSQKIKKFAIRVLTKEQKRSRMSNVEGKDVFEGSLPPDGVFIFVSLRRKTLWQTYLISLEAWSLTTE